MDIAALLTLPDRNWKPMPGATDVDIARLVKQSPLTLPDTFLSLLRYCNGGEGDISLPPLYFVLDPIHTIIEGFDDQILRESFPGLLFFGGNGGLERIAFASQDAKISPSVVMVDPIAGTDSNEIIAKDFDEFVASVGIPSQDPA